MNPEVKIKNIIIKLNENNKIVFAYKIKSHKTLKCKLSSCPHPATALNNPHNLYLCQNKPLLLGPLIWGFFKK